MKKVDIYQRAARKIVMPVKRMSPRIIAGESPLPLHTEEQLRRDDVIYNNLGKKFTAAPVFQDLGSGGDIF